MPRTLGIDASTQSVSAVVIDTEHANVLAEVSVNFGKELPQYKAPQGFIPGGADGEVHSDPCMWLDALEICLKRLSEIVDLSTISAISGAGQQHGTVYLNEQWLNTVGALSSETSLSEQIRPCLSRMTSPIWMDTSTSAECQEIAEKVQGGNQAVCQKSGSVTIERFSGPQIRRFYKQSPAAYASTTRIHLVSSFIASVFSGKDAPIDHGDGAGMNLLNLASGEWDAELLSATAPDLRPRLPAPQPCNTRLGTIAPYFSRKYGFKSDTAVAIFTGDNPSSLVGMGATQPGKVVISLGTSDTFFAAMPEPLTDPDGYGHVFGNPAGGCMTLQCFVNGSLAREAVKDKHEMDWQAFEAAFNHTPVGNDKHLMLPFFRPEISPRIDLNHPILKGSSDFEAGRQPQAEVRACVEGQFMNMHLRTRWMQLHTDTVYLTGGASRNNALAQIIANIFQARVERLAISGSVGLGAALRAAQVEHALPLESLQAIFCKTEPNSATLPDKSASPIYADLEMQWQALLDQQVTAGF